jgi:hypothetical protein
MLLILFVLQDTNKLEQLLDAWEAVGAAGITILPSIGITGYKEKRALREDFPIIPNLEDLVEDSQNVTRSLFTLVPSQDTVNLIYKSTVEIIGDLTMPNTGVFIVLPVSQAFGVRNIDSKD